MVVKADTARKGDTAKPTARERLLAAADELFYKEGVRIVGIDRVIEHAGVAKASLYYTFGSKDALIRAYLDNRRERLSVRVARHVSRYDTPRERLLAVFEAQDEMFNEPTFHGCAFVAASAESQPGDQIEQAVDDVRAWLRQTFIDLAEAAGVPEPAVLARKLHMLYDGGMVLARLDHDPAAATYSRAAAEALLDAALA